MARRLTKDDASRRARASSERPRRARSPRRSAEGPTTSVPPPKPRSRKSSSRSTSAAVAPTPGHRTSASSSAAPNARTRPERFCAAATRHRRQRDRLRHRLPAAGHGVGRVHADDERPAPAAREYGASPGKDGPRFVQPGRRRLDERPRRVLRAKEPFSISVGDEQQPVVGG